MKLKRWAAEFSVLTVGAYLLSAGFAPGGWFDDKLTSCSAPPDASTVKAEPLDNPATNVALIGQRQGEWLRNINTAPPSPTVIRDASDRAASTVLVYVLSLEAATRKQRPPAYVVAYTKDRAKAQAATVAQNIAFCTPPCPTGTPPQTGGGLVNVSLTTSGPGVARAAAAAAGFRGADLDVAVAVAGAESGYSPTAANPTSAARGMWQIMLTVHQDIMWMGDWRDPYVNARMAYSIWKVAGDWSPWEAYTNGAYKPLLTRTVAQQADALPCTPAAGP